MLFWNSLHVSFIRLINIIIYVWFPTILQICRLYLRMFWLFLFLLKDVSISGEHCYSVALDEAHEMKTKLKTKNGKKDHKTNLLFENFCLAYSKFTSNSVSDFDQFLHIPSAICDADDFPENGQKTRATSVFKKMYPDSSILQVTPFPFLFTNLFQIMHHFYFINGLFGLIISLMLQRFTWYLIILTGRERVQMIWNLPCYKLMKMF